MRAALVVLALIQRGGVVWPNEAYSTSYCLRNQLLEIETLAVITGFELSFLVRDRN